MDGGVSCREWDFLVGSKQLSRTPNSFQYGALFSRHVLLLVLR
jgi:hypothetical protein